MIISLVYNRGAYDLIGMWCLHCSLGRFPLNLTSCAKRIKKNKLYDRHWSQLCWDTSQQLGISWLRLAKTLGWKTTKKTLETWVVSNLFCSRQIGGDFWLLVGGPRENNHQRRENNCPHRIPSMGMVVFTWIYHKNQPNAGKHTMHGWYGWSYVP